MSSVHQEAWEGLRDELVKHPEEEYDGIEIVGMMSHYLDTARKRAKEYLEQEKKELDMHPDAVYGRKWLEEQGD